MDSHVTLQRRVLLNGVLPMTFSTSFLMKPRTTSLGIVQATLGWTLPTPHQFLIRKMPSRLAYSLTFWIHFLKWGSHISDDLNLCPRNKTGQHNEGESKKKGHLQNFKFWWSRKENLFHQIPEFFLMFGSVSAHLFPLLVDASQKTVVLGHCPANRAEYH